MSEKPVKVPGPDHPISVTPYVGRVAGSAGGRTIADSTATLALAEAGYPVVHYFPRADVDFPRADVDLGALEPTDHASYCPYKGDASYFSIVVGEDVLSNAAWSYERPHAPVAQIEGHIAFYSDKVEIAER